MLLSGIYFIICTYTDRTLICFLILNLTLLYAIIISSLFISTNRLGNGVLIMTSTVLYQPLTKNQRKNAGAVARTLLKTLIKSKSLKLQTEIPLKIHSGEPGNDTFIKPFVFNEIIDYFLKQGNSPYFIETNTAGGPRGTEVSHRKVAKEHGFTRIPFVVADGDGFDHKEVPIPNGTHFKKCKIAVKLADLPQVIVLSHFKGHCMTGFGGAIKMLGLGFASGRGKSELHSSKPLPSDKQIDWTHSILKSVGDTVTWNPEVVYFGQEFAERVAEYALAAARGKRHIYVSFAYDITPNCDCDGKHMENKYEDLGIFASTDPVAIDKAVFDQLTKREGKIPFEGSSIFAYAEKIGLGSTSYSLKIC